VKAAKSSIEEMTKNLTLQVSSSPKKAAPKETATSPPATEGAADKEASAATPGVKSEGTADHDNTMDVDGPEASGDGQPTDEEDNESIISKAATIALSTSAARASALASHEEREMTKLVNAVVNCNLKKLEHKLNQFNELEQVLQAERREIEKARQQLFLERLAMRTQCAQVQEQLKRAIATGGQEGYMIATEAARMGSQGQKLQFESASATANASGIPQIGARPPSLENPTSYVAFEA